MRENIPMIQGIDIGSRSCSPWVFSRLGVLEGQPQKHRHRSYQLVYLKSWLLLYSFWRKIKKRKRSSSIVLPSSFNVFHKSFLRLRFIECLIMNGMKHVGREWTRIEWKGTELPFHCSAILSWNRWFHPHALQIEGKERKRRVYSIPSVYISFCSTSFHLFQSIQTFF